MYNKIITGHINELLLLIDGLGEGEVAADNMFEMLLLPVDGVDESEETVDRLCTIEALLVDGTVERQGTTGFCKLGKGVSFFSKLRCIFTPIG